MKKNELIHLHSLLLTVAEAYVESNLASPDDFEEYVDLGVTPRSLREPRPAHERAVRVLARLLTDATKLHLDGRRERSLVRAVTDNH